VTADGTFRIRMHRITILSCEAVCLVLTCPAKKQLLIRKAKKGELHTTLKIWRMY